MKHRKHPFVMLRQISLISILGILLLVLSACGPGASSTTTGSGGTTGTSITPTPTSTATTGKGNSNVRGCPNTTVVSTAPKQANVTIHSTDVNSTISAHIGDTIEIRLPFGQKWSGPVAVPTNLQLQQPAGYTFPSGNVCVWRFVAQSAGMTHLEFHSQAICSMGQMCSMYIAVYPFIIDVK